MKQDEKIKQEVLNWYAGKLGYGNWKEMYKYPHANWEIEDLHIGELVNKTISKARTDGLSFQKRNLKERKHEDENSWLEFMSKTELAPIDRVNFMKDRIEEEVEQARQECEKEKELLQEASYKCGKRVARATAISEVRELLKINLDTGALEAHNIKILDEFDKKFKI